MAGGGVAWPWSTRSVTNVPAKAPRIKPQRAKDHRFIAQKPAHDRGARGARKGSALRNAEGNAVNGKMVFPRLHGSSLPRPRPERSGEPGGRWRRGVAGRRAGALTPKKLGHTYHTLRRPKRSRERQV